MIAARNEQLPPWVTGRLGPQANILSQQHNIPCTAIQGHGGPVSAAMLTQRNCYPIHQHGNTHASSALDASDPIVSMIALHIALQQKQLETINSNRRSEDLTDNINTQAFSSMADSRSMITNALTSQLGAVFNPPNPISSSPQWLGGSTPPNLSVPSRQLQQLLTARTPARTTNNAEAQSSTIEHLHSSAALVTIAALLLQVEDGRGALTHTPLVGTVGSPMPASTTPSTNSREAESMMAVVGTTQNQVSLPTVGMSRPLTSLPTTEHQALLKFFLQDPAFLAALPAAMSMTSMTAGGIPQACLSAPVRLEPLADSGCLSSISLRAESLGHNREDRKLPRIIHVPSDDSALSPYQCLVRWQIELFEASEADIHATAQGRNRPIIVGQVGIRCIHCGRLPIERRARGAVYFPSTLMSTYQTAQNMANSHLMKDCLDIPRYIREDLVRIRLRENSESQNTRKSAFGGGRAYWARGLQTNHGVIETEDRRLKFDSFVVVG